MRVTEVVGEQRVVRSQLPHAFERADGLGVAGAPRESARQMQSGEDVAGMTLEQILGQGDRLGRLALVEQDEHQSHLRDVSDELALAIRVRDLKDASLASVRRSAPGDDGA